VQVKPPNGAAVSAFSEAIERLTGGKDASLLLAVSGGPDSLAMLLLAHAAMPERICAATVDHGLRPDAKQEAELVATLCGKLGILHRILRPSTPITGNLQSEARAARYALLQAQADVAGCDFIATAHHADDQLETVLMRIARGSGINGLAGVRARQGRLIRPMLAFTKTELDEICGQFGIAPIYDPSNTDSSFDRVAMRQWLAANPHPFDAHRAVRTATAFADATEALEWATSRAFEAHVSGEADSMTLDPHALPREIQRRVLLRILDQIQPGYIPRGDALDRALDTLKKGGSQLLGDVLYKGGKLWRFRPAPQRRQ
jgi:tRNA(Ile)-lysidine synthase